MNTENALKAGRELRESVLRNAQTIGMNAESVANTVDRVLTYSWWGRIVITVVMLAWMGALSYLIATPKKDSENGDVQRARYYNLHRIWFGDQSALMILVTLWYYTIILMILGPIIKEIGLAIKARSALGLY